MNPEENLSASSSETPAKPLVRSTTARLIDKIQTNVALSITADELHQSGGQQKTLLMDEPDDTK